MPNLLDQRGFTGEGGGTEKRQAGSEQTERKRQRTDKETDNKTHKEPDSEQLDRR